MSETMKDCPYYQGGCADPPVCLCKRDAMLAAAPASPALGEEDLAKHIADWYESEGGPYLSFPETSLALARSILSSASTDKVRELGAEVARLEKQVYVPGLWRCPKCNFQLVQANLHAATGTVSARDEPGDKCPNCNRPLWRTTERQARKEMELRCEEQMTRAEKAEAALAEAAKVIEPFVNFIDEVDTDPNGYPWRDDQGMLKGLKIGAFRAARDWYARHPEQSK